MSENQLLKAFRHLPPDAQQQVIDFISFLQNRYDKMPRRRADKSISKLNDEGFVGMWQNRQEMEDSSDWVMQVREKEWGGKL